MRGDGRRGKGGRGRGRIVRSEERGWRGKRGIGQVGWCRIGVCLRVLEWGGGVVIGAVVWGVTGGVG